MRQLSLYNVCSLPRCPGKSKKVGVTTFLTCKSNCNTCRLVSQVHTSHFLIVDLHWQKTAHHCVGTILGLPLNSPTLTRMTDCLYEVDGLLVFLHKTMYIPNSLGIVLASVKVNSLQNCWILVGSCGTATVRPVLQSSSARSTLKKYLSKKRWWPMSHMCCAKCKTTACSGLSP